MIRREILRRKDLRRKIKNTIALSGVCALSLLAVVPLFLVVSYLFKQGLPALNFSFFTELPKPVGETGGGMANAIVGSILIVGMAALVGVPWGIGVGVYLSEFGRGKFAMMLRFVIDLLTSIPSIVIGLFAYAVLVQPMKGFSAYAGALALTIIILPIIARSTEEMLKLVPSHVREAGLALGIPRWRVILSIVLKGSRSAVLTGVMLALARAFGESAPLLFTSFNNQFWARGLDQPTASLPIQIFTYAISPFEDWQRQAWAGSLVLIFIVFGVNITTRAFFAYKSRGSNG